MVSFKIFLHLIHILSRENRAFALLFYDFGDGKNHFLNGQKAKFPAKTTMPSAALLSFLYADFGCDAARWSP